MSTVAIVCAISAITFTLWSQREDARDREGWAAWYNFVASLNGLMALGLAFAVWHS